MSVLIRLATASDIERILELMEAHAAFERSGPVSATTERLTAQLIEEEAASCFVAESDGVVVGYATAAPEYSTWHASHYLHMDTLFVDEAERGAGIGRLLFDAVRQLAADAGFSQVQWQTPEWNTDAIRFYERVGANGVAKRRFALETT